jgi:L-lysine 6-transaminase
MTHTRDVRRSEHLLVGGAMRLTQPRARRSTKAVETPPLPNIPREKRPPIADIDRKKSADSQIRIRREVVLQPEAVHETIARCMLADGYPFVMDLAKSRGQYIHDAKTGRDLLDCMTFYASRPVAFDHPGLLDPEYQSRLLLAASRTKPANGDVYTVEYAEFVETFRRLALGQGMKHLFLIDGGSAAVENAMKAAFDWKARKNKAAGRRPMHGKAIHFKNAFDGRGGYAISLTNTADPNKTKYFPKWKWPRLPSPAVEYPLNEKTLKKVIAAEEQTLKELERTFERMGDHRIACIVIEPMQSEGGDRHFRPEFLEALRAACDRHECLLVFDEVQTGMGATGTMWYYEGIGVIPDLVAFGKKSQICGVMAGPRLDEIPDNVFTTPSRISSTFGGNLVDCVRATRYLEIIHQLGLVQNAKEQGAYLLNRISDLTAKHPRLSSARGKGLLIAFDADTTATRNAIIERAYDEGLLILPCGKRSIRLRPALDFSRKDGDEALARLSRAVERALGTGMDPISLG